MVQVSQNVAVRDPAHGADAYDLAVELVARTRDDRAVLVSEAPDDFLAVLASGHAKHGKGVRKTLGSEGSVARPRALIACLKRIGQPRMAGQHVGKVLGVDHLQSRVQAPDEGHWSVKAVSPFAQASEARRKSR